MSPNKSTTVRTEAPALKAAKSGLRWLSPRAPSLAAMWAERLFLTARRFERPFWERQALAGARQARVDFEGSWLPAWIWRPASQGSQGARLFDGPKTVLLVHGWEGRGSQLASFVAPLLDRGFRVVTFDAAGHGDAHPRRASLVDHARSIAAVAAQLGPIDAVIAHSVGGAATLLATRYGLEAERFALIAPPRSAAGYVAGFSRFFGLEPDVHNAMVERVEARYGLRIADLDVTSDAAKLGAPLLVVHDREDTMVPIADGRALADTAPLGLFLETKGLGHRKILRAPDVIASVARFVAAGRQPTFAETLDGELFLRESRW